MVPEIILSKKILDPEKILVQEKLVSKQSRVQKYFWVQKKINMVLNPSDHLVFVILVCMPNFGKIEGVSNEGCLLLMGGNAVSRNWLDGIRRRISLLFTVFGQVSFGKHTEKKDTSRMAKKRAGVAGGESFLRCTD